MAMTLRFRSLLPQLSRIGLVVPRDFSFFSRSISSVKPSRLQVKITSDIACPWCYVGVEAMERALETFSNQNLDAQPLELERRWNPYFVNSSVPPEGVNILEYYKKNWGVPEQVVLSPHNPLRKAGEKVGIKFTFDRKIVNSFRGHCLVALAQEQGCPTEMVQELFKRLFVDGLDINDDAELQAAAEAVGVTGALEALASEEKNDAVHKAESEARKEATEVPHFVFETSSGKRYVLKGVPKAEEFCEVFREACEGSEAGSKPFDAAGGLNQTSKDHDGAVELYDAWADTYDESLRSWGYEAPEKIAEYLKKYMSADLTHPKVIDQGCGTGLSGEAIKKVFPGAILTGTDCSGDSIKLLHEQKPGLYADAYILNLDKLYNEQPSTGIDKIADDSFDGCICVGVTSYIQNFDNCIAEWIRIVKPGGVIVFTHRTNIYDEDNNGAKSVYEKFEKEEKWTLLEKTEPLPYMPMNPLPEESQKKIYYITYQVK